MTPFGTKAYERLLALPGYWQGAAQVRKDMAGQALALRQDKEADEHLRMVNKYEQEAKLRHAGK